MRFEEITCPSCASRHVKKNGTTANRKQKYRCQECLRQFITRYTYQGCLKFVRDLVVPMTMNGSGIRDIARVLSISTNTVTQDAARACRTSCPTTLAATYQRPRR